MFDDIDNIQLYLLNEMAFHTYFFNVMRYKINYK